MSANRLRDNIQNRKLVQQHYSTQKKEVSVVFSFIVVRTKKTAAK